MELSGQTAIVTGAGRGIGRMIAKALSSKGVSVVLASRTLREIESLAEDFTASGSGALAIPGDVGVEVDAERIVETAVRTYGRVDILVNNAGIGVFKPVAEMAVSEADAMWNVNVRGVFLMTRSVLRYMLQQGSGAIVNISSLAGKNPVKGGALYAATKWALRGFASSLMLEVRDRNIRVITVFPGSVDTSFSQKNRRGAGITQPEDVADAVIFALSAPARTMISEIDIRPSNPK